MRPDELAATGYVARGGFLGSVLGLVAAVALAALERKSFTSIKRLMGLVALVDVLLWVVITILSSLAANGTL